jgi:hypothetical protein
VDVDYLNKLEKISFVFRVSFQPLNVQIIRNFGHRESATAQSRQDNSWSTCNAPTTTKQHAYKALPFKARSSEGSKGLWLGSLQHTMSSRVKAQLQHSTISTVIPMTKAIDVAREMSSERDMVWGIIPIRAHF